MTGPASEAGAVMSRARTIRWFTDEPVDDATLARCLQAATWAPSGANAQEWRFVVLRSPEPRAVVAEAATPGMKEQKPLSRMQRPAHNDHTRRPQNNRAANARNQPATSRHNTLYTQ